ncbi:Ribokinase-like protein [Gautieria morchelliformis]|nr:Ribokinase-like protein [Gautieria morchelliformis]
MPIPKEILSKVKLLIPPLTGKLHKGQSGRVGVVGGAQDYTGAPFFAAISALRMGADLSHVICSPTAAGAIKSYSPDLIVHPILCEGRPTESVRSELNGVLERLHVLVIGPGLGREDYMQKYARLAIKLAKEQDMYVVLDADALWMVQKDPDIVKGYRKAVLTPNIVEFKRLSESVGVPPDSPPSSLAAIVSRKLGGVTVLQKGPRDIVSYSDFESQGNNEDVEMTVEVDTQGGLKRCGGQGDILSGVTGTMLAWGMDYEQGAFNSEGETKVSPCLIPLLASVGGSMVTRTASRRAFERYGRGLVTQDILPDIGGAFAEVFGEEIGRKASL